MTKSTLAAALLLAVLPAVALAKTQNQIEFHYAIHLDRDGRTFITNPLFGFEDSDRLKLRLHVKQQAYCYIAARLPNGRFRLMPPGAALDPKRSIALPADAWMKLDRHAGSEMLYLILASEPVPELEDAPHGADQEISESLLLKVRDRYQPGGTEVRKVNRAGVKVKFQAEDAGPAMVVEQIYLRHR